MSYSERIREYLAEEMDPPRDPSEIADDYRLIEMGGLDSMAILQLVSFLEDEFELILDNDDLVLDNFETVGSIVQLVTARAA